VRFTQWRSHVMMSTVVVMLAAALVSVILLGLGDGVSHAQSAGIAGMRKVGLEPGDLAPDFSLPTIDGTVVSLSSFRGRKPVLLNLWTVSCPYCHAELEELKKGYEDYKDRLEVLSVCVDSWYPAAYIKQLVAGKGLQFTVLLDQNSAVARSYRVTSVPANYLIDDRGVILAVFIGAIDRKFIENEVYALLP
jgi:peroxiredoxin